MIGVPVTTRIDQLVVKETNTYLVGDDDEVIVVDPGADGEPVLNAVGDREILAVICTNGLEGHVGAALAVAERDEAPVALHRADRTLWRAVHGDDSPDIDIEEGGFFEVGDVRLQVLHTPGHTPGSVSLYCEELDAVLTGDTLLKGGPPGDGPVSADFATLLTSVGEKLLNLPGETRVLCGHGDETTIAAEDAHFDSWVTRGQSVDE